MADFSVDTDAMRNAGAVFAHLADTAGIVSNADLADCGDRGVAAAAERFDDWYRGAAAVVCGRLARAGWQVDAAALAFDETDHNLASGANS